MESFEGRGIFFFALKLGVVVHLHITSYVRIHFGEWTNTRTSPQQVFVLQRLCTVLLLVKRGYKYVKKKKKKKKKKKGERHIKHTHTHIQTLGRTWSKKKKNGLAETSIETYNCNNNKFS
jgi:hypothetical protein